MVSYPTTLKITLLPPNTVIWVTANFFRIKRYSFFTCENRTLGFLFTLCLLLESGFIFSGVTLVISSASKKYEKFKKFLKNQMIKNESLGKIFTQCKGGNFHRHSTFLSNFGENPIVKNKNLNHLHRHFNDPRKLFSVKGSVI